MVYRPDLHRVLVEAVQALDAQAIVLNAKVTVFTEDGDQVHATLAGGRRFSGRALIGEDGVHSTIRKQIFGDGAARMSGCMT